MNKSYLGRNVVCCVPEGDGRYRYWLEVRLGEGGCLAVILKNPSTAGAERSDPTAGKVEAWARRRGYGRLILVNLFARRSTDPSDINRYPYPDAVGPENDHYLRRAADVAQTLVAAWGNPNGIERERYDRRIAEALALLGERALGQVGGRTRLGYPRHGLWWGPLCHPEYFTPPGAG